MWPNGKRDTAKIRAILSLRVIMKVFPKSKGRSIENIQMPSVEMGIKIRLE
jgi:hypothetical protein